MELDILPSSELPRKFDVWQVARHKTKPNILQKKKRFGKHDMSTPLIGIRAGRFVIMIALEFFFRKK